MKNNKGFTLMEMLIVVAIIAVLVAIAIPTMTSALEKSREATDAANIRAAYAEIMVMALTEDYPSADKTVGKITYKKATESAGVHSLEATVTACQKQAGWQTTALAGTGAIGGNTVEASTTGWTITYTEGDDNAAIAKQ